MSEFGTDLTTGSIPKHIWAFSLPMLIGSFLQTAYSFVNAIWVGQFLGTQALAAVTVSFPVIFVVFGFGLGMTLATNILISQAYGAKKFDELRLITDSSVILVFGISVFFAIFGWIFSPEILSAMNTPPDVLHLAVDYLRIFVLSLPFAFGMFLIRSMLQGVGDSKTPLYFLLGSVLLTAALDPVLIFGKFGFPKLGLNGTAWATLFSETMALILASLYLNHSRAPISIRWPHLKHLGPITAKTIRIGLPSSVQQCLLSIGFVLITGIVNSYGELATAALGAASRIDMIVFMPAMSFGMAISTLTGQNLGAGRLDRVRQIFKWGCLFTAAITLTITLIVEVFPELLLRIFTPDVTVISMGASYLHIVGISYLFFALMFISSGVINGAGATLSTTIISLVSLWVVRVPGAYYLSQHLKSVTGVWYAVSFSFALSMVASMAYYFSGHWLVTFKKNSHDSREA